MSTAWSFYYFLCVAAFGQHFLEILGMHGSSMKKLNFYKNTTALESSLFAEISEILP